MQRAATTPTAPALRPVLWTGRIISGAAILFLTFDAIVKVLATDTVVESSANLGYPESTIVPIGLTLLVATALYAIPRTAVLGAILLTGYLGGAVATQVRIEEAWFLFPAIFGVLVWAGLYLRDDRLRALLPFTSTTSTSVPGHE